MEQILSGYCRTIDASRMVLVAVSYTHLTLPTNSLV